MKKSRNCLIIVLLVVSAMAPDCYYVSGHGMLLDPPERSSVWRLFPGAGIPNYNDNGINCGGRGVYNF